MRIGDLIEVPEIKTVIQLKDLQDSHLQQMILHSFVVTGEVQDSLERILTSFSQPEGRGVFLKGHFGSGKSHFLSMLSLLLRHAESWKVLLDQAPSLENLRIPSIGLSAKEISAFSSIHLKSWFWPCSFPAISWPTRDRGRKAWRIFPGTDSRGSPPWARGRSSAKISGPPSPSIPSFQISSARGLLPFLPRRSCGMT